MSYARIVVPLACALMASAQTSPQAKPRNIIIFVADGLRPGSVTAAVAPTMLSIRQRGVYFANSHAMFPTFTTANAAAIATGHYLGDTGDFSNTIYSGFPAFNTGLFPNPAGTVTPFLENDQILADMDAHFKGNYMTETTLMALARANGYQTASIGKLGPVGIQDVTEVRAAPGIGFVSPRTVIIDDSTGLAAGVPIATSVVNDFAAAGLSKTTTPRNQPSGTNATAGTLNANLGQQQYFADAATKVVLPDFVNAGKPFFLVFWSRDPDGTQHNQGDSLNSLTPGINGPTSVASITNADNNLKQILSFLNSNPSVAANTDVFLTADHGFATISKHETDMAGHVSASYSTQFIYKDSTGRQEVNTGFLPVGFLAIDIAHALNLPLFDPDVQVKNASGTLVYERVDPTAAQQTATIRQHSASGNGLIGGTGAILNTTDATVVVAANGGSDLVYVPGGSAALVQQIVTFLASQDYVDGLFVNDAFGPIAGALPMSAINMIGNTSVPTPSIVVNFKTFATDPKNPLMTAVQIADSALQEGQGMHGTLSRDNTFNNMAAMGPDFKVGYVDNAPISNADIVPTIASIIGLPISTLGKLTGRVITEALVGNPDNPLAVSTLVQASAAAPSGKKTVLTYQQLGSNVYFDWAKMSSTATQATIANKNAALYSRFAQLDGSQSVAGDGGALTYSWTLSQGSSSGVLIGANTAQPYLSSSGRGTYTVTLTVTDSSGASSTDSSTLVYQGQ